MEKQKQYPKIVTSVLIYNDKNEIFLARGVKWENKWTVPGGHLEWGESFEESIKREVKEETNLEIENVELLGIQEAIFPPAYHKKKHMVFLDFCAKVLSGDVILNNEHSEYKWFSLDEIPYDELNESVKSFIEKFKKNRG
jgi:nucleoside triphosphatase